MTKFYCEHPQHPDVDRAVAPSDRRVLTVDVMNQEGTQRIARVGPWLTGDTTTPPNKGGLRLCRQCANKVVDQLRDGRTTLNLAVGFGAEQESLL